MTFWNAEFDPKLSGSNKFIIAVKHHTNQIALVLCKESQVMPQFMTFWNEVNAVEFDPNF